MLDTSIEYVCVVGTDRETPDPAAWQEKLLELGLHREAFSVNQSPTGNTVVKFWELDRPEALRILAKLDGMRMSPQF